VLGLPSFYLAALFSPWCSLQMRGFLYNCVKTDHLSEGFYLSLDKATVLKKGANYKGFSAAKQA